MPHKDRKKRLACIRAHHEKHRPSPAPIDRGDLPPLGAMRTSDDGAKVQCHVCGRWFGSLNTHLRTHDMDADAYKEEFDLPRTMSLLPPVVQERYRAATTERDQGNRFRDALPPGQPRPKGIGLCLGSCIAGSAARKGRYRGKPVGDGQS